MTKQGAQAKGIQQKATPKQGAPPKEEGQTPSKETSQTEAIPKQGDSKRAEKAQVTRKRERKLKAVEPKSMPKKEEKQEEKKEEKQEEKKEEKKEGKKEGKKKEQKMPGSSKGIKMPIESPDEIIPKGNSNLDTLWKEETKIKSDEKRLEAEIANRELREEFRITEPSPEQVTTEEKTDKTGLKDKSSDTKQTKDVGGAVENKTKEVTIE
jgi:hypothetical protein